MASEFHNLLKYPAQLNDRYPDCWKKVDHLKQTKDICPAYCFLQISAAHQVINSGAMPKSNSEAGDISRLAALAAWRITQGVYRFDRNLYSELIDMEVAALPIEVLRCLPEWCVYIELQDDTWASGVFVHLEHNAEDNSDQLRLLFETNFEGKTGVDRLYPLWIHLDGSLQDSLARHKRMIEEFETRNAVHSGLDFKLVNQRVTEVVSLILYLCSANADMDRPTKGPTPTRTKNGLRWFPAATQSIWEVGYRIGPILGASYLTEQRNNEGTGSNVRPHVRRAHWHHYWVGPKNDQAVILKWLSPVLVNVKDPSDLTATIRPLKHQKGLYAVLPES